MEHADVLQPTLFGNNALPGDVSYALGRPFVHTMPTWFARGTVSPARLRPQYHPLQVLVSASTGLPHTTPPLLDIPLHHSITGSHHTTPLLLNILCAIVFAVRSISTTRQARSPTPGPSFIRAFHVCVHRPCHVSADPAPLLVCICCVLSATTAPHVSLRHATTHGCRR